jgi:hypothetical protein
MGFVARRPRSVSAPCEKEKRKQASRAGRLDENQREATMASDDVRFTKEMALAWYYLPAMFDALAAPMRWKWSEEDQKVNDLLNSVVDATTEQLSEWRSETGRKPADADDTDWQPRYFPDDPYDEVVAGAKHALIMEASRLRKDALADILDDPTLARRIDHAGVLDTLSDGDFLFSPAQYVTAIDWIRSSVPDYARSPETRWQIFRMWTDAPLLTDPEHAERAQQMLRGGSVYRVTPEVGARLNRIMLGEDDTDGDASEDATESLEGGDE